MKKERGWRGRKKKKMEKAEGHKEIQTYIISKTRQEED
jgi:hypothetical protein